MKNLLVLMVSLLCFSLGVLGGTEPLHAQSSAEEIKAETYLKRYLEKTLPPRGLSMDCVILIQEEVAPGFLQYAVRENHGGKCPGDPSTSPIIDRYRVLTMPYSLQRWDAAKDEWNLVSPPKLPLSPAK